MKAKIYKTAADINKAIASIASRGAKLDASIQLTGLSVIAHASEHGDTTLADKIVQAMPKGARKLALVEWMLAFGQIAKLDREVDKLAIAEGRLFKLDRAKKLDLDEAENTPWTEFKPEAAPLDAFDAQAAVQSVMARLAKATAAGVPVKHREEALKQAQALVGILTAEA